MSLKEIEQLIDANKYDEALTRIESALVGQTESPELLFCRGKIRMKQEKWGSAINDFNRVLELQPTNEVAQNHVQMIRSILGFFNPDLHNP